MIRAKTLSAQEDLPHVTNWVHPRIVLLDIEARDRTHALEIAATAAAASCGQDSAPWFRALERREQAGSTALGCGIAIPHARVAGITEPLTVYLRPTSALRFGTSGDETVSQLLVILVPPCDVHDEHLQLLAIVAQLFSMQPVRRQLLAAADAAAVIEAFREGLGQVRVTSACTTLGAMRQVSRPARLAS